MVHRNPPNQLALASHLGIDRTVMTYLLDTLVKAGLVERIPDPSDRRARKVVPTTKGEGCLADFEQRMAAVERQFLSGLSEREASELESTMHRLAMIVHREQPGASPCEAMDNLP
nr:marR family protein [Rhodococcus sp. JVH1]